MESRPACVPFLFGRGCGGSISMFDKTTVMRECRKIRVILRYGPETLGEETGGLDGYLYARADQRLQDILNDERAFVPFESLTGECRTIAKSAILDAREVRKLGVSGEDPYAILGASRDASPEELKRAYLERLKSAHPDRLASLRLDPALIDAAKTLCQNLNNAYDRILRERKAAERNAA